MTSQIGHFRWLGQHMWKWTRNNGVICWKYMKVEMKPPTIKEWPQIRQGFRDLTNGFKTRSWRELTFKDAWLNTLVGFEVCMWFWIGECIGKRRFYGYYVPPKQVKLDSGGVPYEELGEKPVAQRGSMQKLFGTPPEFALNTPDSPEYHEQVEPPKESLHYKKHHGH